MREKVALSNRAEALQSIVPQAQDRKGSAKISKPSATSKPSIKHKPSARSKLSKHLKPSAKTKPALAKRLRRSRPRRQQLTNNSSLRKACLSHQTLRGATPSASTFRASS